MFSGAAKNRRVEKEETMAQLNKMKQRPMTGAVVSGGRTLTKNRRFGPYLGMPSGYINLNDYRTTNPSKSKEHHTNTLQTFDQQRDQSGGILQGLQSKNDLRNRSTAYFSTT